MPVPQAASPQASAEPVPSRFVVGQDDEGHWLAVEIHRLGGGLFRSRADAVHFASFETGHRPDAVEFATAPLRLLF